MAQNELQRLHTDWLEDLEIGKGRSSKTVENYDKYLQSFYEQQEISSVSDITLDTIRQFRRWLNTRGDGGEGLSIATQNYYLIAIRQFLKYLAKRDIACLAPEKVELAKLPEREIDVLYPEEVDALLHAPLSSKQSNSNTFKGRITALRDHALLQTLFSTGVRISEAVRLNRDDIREHSQEIPVRGKGSKVRVVFLSTDAYAALRDYLGQRTDLDPALFIRHHITPKADVENDTLRLSPRSIQRMIKKRAAEGGITKNITPHTLRHSFATDLLSNGADVRQVQQLLGHSSITTTQVYTHLTDVHLRGVHERFHRRSDDV